MLQFIMCAVVIIVVLMELSTRISTKSIWQKVGLCMLLVGALIRLKTQNMILPAGLLIYLAATTWNAYKAKRRADD